MLDRRLAEAVPAADREMTLRKPAQRRGAVCLNVTAGLQEVVVWAKRVDTAARAPAAALGSPGERHQLVARGLGETAHLK
jgi:hypothetical protein